MPVVLIENFINWNSLFFYINNFVILFFNVYFCNLMKKTILIIADKFVIERYKVQSFDYFKSIGNLEEHTYANYARKFIAIIENIFFERYGSLDLADVDDIKFFRKNTKEKNIPDRYIINNVSQLTLLLENDYIIRFYNIMNTFYINELSDEIKKFSFSMFIVDVLNIMNDVIYN